MTPVLAFLGALLGILALCLVVALYRCLADFYLGRSLRQATGSHDRALSAIEAERLARELREKCERVAAEQSRYPVRCRVIQLHSGGRPIRYTNNGDAA